MSQNKHRVKCIYKQWQRLTEKQKMQAIKIHGKKFEKEKIGAASYMRQSGMWFGVDLGDELTPLYQLPITLKTGKI